MFNDFELHIPQPSFNSTLTEKILELDRLRHLKLGGSTPAPIFFQLKEIFHLLESIGSLRIEGNNTTIAEYIEDKITPDLNPSDSINEIKNNEKAMSFIEDNIQNISVNNMFIREIQKIIVKDLKRDGDKNPGVYRTCNVTITNSQHTPPDHTQVEGYMEELIKFINEKNAPQFDLLKTAIVHHRFTWIHPFRNGNGRTVRALTYAMLIQQGFNIEKGRIINPTAVFCGDRNLYYDMLSVADSGKDEGLLKWSEYVLNGLSVEIEKIDKLLDYNYLKKDILEETIKHAFEAKLLNEKERKVLLISIEKESFQASDIKSLFPENVAHTEISRFIRNMREKKLIKSISENARKYVIDISSGYLLRGIMKTLDKKGFLPKI